jgi:GNAT superfamily N-acetyltransferase
VFQIRSPQPKDWPDALRLLLPFAVGGGDLEEVVRRTASDPPAALKPGMRVAVCDGEVVAAGCVLAESGAVGSWWPIQFAPRVLQREPADTIFSSLEGELLQIAREREYRVLQVTLPGGLPDARRRSFVRGLLEQGFQDAGALDFLVWTSESDPPATPATGWTARAAAWNSPELSDLIDRSYRATQDCPLLNGIITAEEAIAGYRSAGDFRPDWWEIWQHGDEPLGALILADHPADDQVELVYMGLAPEGRGLGGGLEMVRHAQKTTRRAGRARLVLAVDAANERAQDVYLSGGFHRWDRRQLLLRFLSG